MVRQRQIAVSPAVVAARQAAKAEAEAAGAPASKAKAGNKRKKVVAPEPSDDDAQPAADEEGGPAQAAPAPKPVRKPDAFQRRMKLEKQVYRLKFRNPDEIDPLQGIAEECISAAQARKLCVDALARSYLPFSISTEGAELLKNEIQNQLVKLFQDAREIQLVATRKNGSPEEAQLAVATSRLNSRYLQEAFLRGATDEMKTSFYLNADAIARDPIEIVRAKKKRIAALRAKYKRTLQIEYKNLTERFNIDQLGVGEDRKMLIAGAKLARYDFEAARSKILTSERANVSDDKTFKDIRDRLIPKREAELEELNGDGVRSIQQAEKAVKDAEETYEERRAESNAQREEDKKSEAYKAAREARDEAEKVLDLARAQLASRKKGKKRHESDLVRYTANMETLLEKIKKRNAKLPAFRKTLKTTTRELAHLEKECHEHGISKKELELPHHRKRPAARAPAAAAAEDQAQPMEED